ncbi:hypothetical protein PENSUB_9979 [Penicillium subrubescens]|uniref:Uncharacterized protein n=1 Tax=Penicillium subrubescens TaxID=1316194 RepID=A0A1Q5TBT2_9EURO|nr:hypothetical protein PENSUB_9979 [Penicillium subrubescens]
MDIATADQPPSTSTPGPEHTSGDPRLSRVAQRTSIITSHPPVPRQVPTPAETPSSSRALEPVKQHVHHTPNTDVSNRSGGSINHHGSTIDHSNMVPILLKFSELAAVIALKEKEKVLLLDEDVSIKRRLEKAKSKGAFPIVIENIEAEEAESQSKLRKLQQDIDGNEKRRQKMAESLRGFLRQKPVPPTPALISEGVSNNEKIAKLEAENQEMKAELQELKELIMQRKPEIPSGMQAQLSKLENSVYSQSMSNHGTNKRIRKLEEWKDGVENGSIKTSSHSPETVPAQAPDLEPLRQDVEKANGKAAEAQERAAAIGDRIAVLHRDIQSLQTTFDKDQLFRQEQKMRIESAELSLRHVPGLKQRLEALEKERLEFKNAVPLVREARAKLQDLDTRYTTLADRSNGRIAHLESTVRQLQTSEKTSPSVDHSQDKEALADVKQSVEKVENSHRSLWNNVNKLILDMPQLLESSKQVQKCLSVSESLVAAVRSLELRYSNINTEHLVKNMAAAMMEMYPSMAQALEQIAALRGYCNKEIAALKESTKNADSASLDAKMSQLREQVANKLQHLQTCISDQSKSLNDQLDEIWELKNKFQTQSDAFSELGESIPQALQQVERWTELATKLEALSEDLATLRANVEGRDVTETVTGLAEQLETLSGKVDSLGVGPSAQEQAEKATDISGKLFDLTANYQLLEDRLKSQELSKWQEMDELKAGHGNLLGELKLVKNRLESRDGSKKATELAEELKTLSCDFKTLQTKFDEELGSLKARVDSLGPSEELSEFKSEILARIEKFQSAVQSGLNCNPAAGDDAINRAISNPSNMSGSVGDHYRILGNAARNQTERGHVQNRSSISHPAADEPISSDFGSSNHNFDIMPNVDNFSDVSELDSVSHHSSEDEPGNAPGVTADLPMGLRISENDNGHHDSRSANKRARQGTLSGDKHPVQSATVEVPMAYRITENETGPSRKRPRQGSFSDDGRRPRPAAPSRFANSTGASADSESASSAKARKKQDKKERKEQRRKQRQSFPH